MLVILDGYRSPVAAEKGAVAATGISEGQPAAIRAATIRVAMVGAARAVRRRVRLRTRACRARQRWRSLFPRRLPAWSDSPAAPTTPAAPAVPAAPGTSTTSAVPAAACASLVQPLPGGRVVVDAASANPSGRQGYGRRLPTGRLRVALDGAGSLRWEIARVPDGTPVVAGRIGDPLDGRQRAVLAALGLVTCPPADHPGYPHLLAQLAMTGVLVHAPDLPAAIADRLAPELASLLAAPPPDRTTDALAREARSVRQRRAAMRHHAAGLDPPPVSAVLVSKRPHLLPRAVAAVAAQTYPGLEIVVGCHGHPPPPLAPAGDRAGRADRALRVVPVPAGCNLGQALAAATAAATGQLITKVDDDDRYGPEHVWDLVLARHYAGATVAGKGAEFVHLARKDLTVRRWLAAETATDTVAGGTLLLSRADLAAAGGWPPVPRWVDRALLDRVLGDGGQVYRTHPLGFVYTRHGDGHTWQADPADFLHDVRQRWHGQPPPEVLG